ncbi:MAG TPA: type II secretion system protein [Gemmatimonadaceae bacterium]|jgi:type II secretory pathway pseudopilin PulG|nr:type II secretion system protein [Gemmatimonadaceae bacterium]
MKRRMIMRMSSRRGFTLLEAAVAAVIVGLTAVGVLSAFGTELRASARARRALDADALAVDRLARVRLLARADINPLPDSLRQGQFLPPFQEYRWQLSSEAVRGERDGENGLFDVAVVIQWDEGSYGLSTQIYRP